MGIFEKQGISTSIGSYVGVVLGYVNMGFLYPNLLQDEDFGLIRLLISGTVMLSFLAELGLSTSVIKFYPTFKNSKKETSRLFSLVLLIGTISVTTLCIFLTYTSDTFKPFFDSDFELFLSHNREVVIMTVGITISEIIFGISRAQLQSTAPVFIKEVFLRIAQTILILLAEFQKISFDLFALIFALLYPLQAIGTIIFLKIQDKLHLSSKLPSKTKIKEVINYSLYMAMMKIPNNAMSHIDVIMLGLLTNLKDVAVYSVSAFLSSLVVVPSKALNQVSTPILSLEFQSGNLDEVDKIINQTSGTIFYVVGFTLIYVNSITPILNNFIELDNIALMVPLTFILGIGKAINSMSGTFIGLLSVSNQHKRGFWISFITLLFSILSNLILIPPFGIYGAAYATALTLIFFNIAKLIAVWYMLRITILNKRFVLSLTYIAAATISIHYIDLNQQYIELLIKVLATTFFGIIGVLVFNLAPELKRVILRYLSLTRK